VASFGINKDLERVGCPGKKARRLGHGFCRLGPLMFPEVWGTGFSGGMSRGFCVGLRPKGALGAPFSDGRLVFAVEALA
jgi:hypothetical protein